MFLYNNFLYYNTPTNPDGTKFELPSGAKLLNKKDEEYIIGLKMEDIVIGNVVEKWKEVIYNIYKHLSLPLILFKNYLKEGRDTTYLVSKFSDTELIDICNYLKIVFNSSDSKLDKINLIIEYLNNNV